MDNVLHSPFLYMVAIMAAFAGAFWAKRDVADALIAGLVAPMILAPIWVMMFLVTMLLGVPAKAMAPEITAAVIEYANAMPALVLFLVHPATLLTGFVYGVYCYTSRDSVGLPSGYSARLPQHGDHNAFSRTIRR